MEKGHISIHAQNIMPIIKKWLYSDRDIFLRELVSNACDAISKHSMVVQKGDTAAEENYRVDVIIDTDNSALIIADNGVGMTADEVTRYIAQVAFSGAEEFLAKYKAEDGESGGIIGHFGLGFYSAFMVAKQVTIDTLSWEPGAQAVRWVSEDGMEYEIGESNRTERGTMITLTLDDESKEFIEQYTVRQTLEKYCAFMPIPIWLSKAEPEKPKKKKGKKKDEDEGDEEAGKPEQINDTKPLWLKRPNEVTDEEYLEFYKKVFRDYEQPLFWIHLNAEYPFNLKGILYFPKIKNEFTANEGEVKLYNNQVFVADNIKEIIPEFLLLLKGAIDCPDLPLNVSRSFLQNDGYVKKLSAYITRKVADRLLTEFNTKRENYQKYWDDIHPFIKYGCIRDEKFYERVKDALMFKTVDDEYLTIKEYTDKLDGEEKLVFYASDKNRQAQMIKLHKDQGKDVILMDTLIDNNFMSFMEYGAKDKLTFKRVDSGVEGLTEDSKTDETARAELEKKFRAALGDEQLEVKLQKFKTGELPAMMTVDEQSRRFTEMSRQWGRDFKMPEKRTLVLNSEHPLIEYLTVANGENETAALLMNQVADLSEMARQPLEPERMVEFLKRSNQLMEMAVKKEV